MIKYQAALDYFKERGEGDNLTVTVDWLGFADDLQELVDKSIPKKVLKTTYSIMLVEYGLCPVCDDWTQKGNYCRHCGQRLVWSDEE